jgi:hypothetical protein
VQSRDTRVAAGRTRWVGVELVLSSFMHHGSNSIEESHMSEKSKRPETEYFPIDV